MPYATQADAENIFGVSNIAAWSQLDNTVATADTARIELASEMADEFINVRLEASQYLIPLQPRKRNMLVVTDLAARMMGVWLYETRGMADNQNDDADLDPNRNKIAGHRKYVENFIKQVRCGKIWLPCQYIRNYTTQPTIIG